MDHKTEYFDRSTMNFVEQITNRTELIKEQSKIIDTIFRSQTDQNTSEVKLSQRDLYRIYSQNQENLDMAKRMFEIEHEYLKDENKALKLEQSPKQQYHSVFEPIKIDKHVHTRRPKRSNTRIKKTRSIQKAPIKRNNELPKIKKQATDPQTKQNLAHSQIKLGPYGLKLANSIKLGFHGFKWVCKMIGHGINKIYHIIKRHIHHKYMTWKANQYQPRHSYQVPNNSQRKGRP